MSDLDIKPISVEEAKAMTTSSFFDITLKLDGTMIYYKDGKLFSPRCERSERYNHICEVLTKNNFPDCVGEMFINKPCSNVFDISRKENWKSASYMIFDLIGNNKPYLDRMEIIDKLIDNIGCEFIIKPKRFETFVGGWAYVQANEAEGLVIRNNFSWFKCKLLKEAKVEIIEWIPMKDKGTFILATGSKVSGTSVGFVNQFKALNDNHKKAFAELEYPFLTNDGNYFQPRLRRIIDEEEALKSSTPPIFKK